MPFTMEAKLSSVSTLQKKGKGGKADKLLIDDSHVGRPPGNVAPVDAHGNANVGLGQGWRVVDAAAGDGHRLAPLLALLHDEQLLLWGRPEFLNQSIPQKMAFG